MPMSSFRRKRSNKTSNGSNNNSSNNNSNERVRSTTRSTSSGGKSAENNSVESGGYAIKPLSTVGDSGKPSHSVANDLRRVVNFIQDERHLVAHELYEDVKSRLESLNQIKRELDSATATSDPRGKEKRSWGKTKRSNATQFDEDDYNKARELVKEHEEKFETLTKRALLFLKARDDMEKSEEWTLAQTLFGVTTFYRREDDGSLSIKLEGELQGIPLFEQIAVLREIDLHCHWAPFVTSSLTLGHLDKLDTVGWIMVGLRNFGIARDGCFRAIGCDCVAEDGSVLLVGHGVEDQLPGADFNERAKFLCEDPILKTLDIPPVPTRMGSGRMTIKNFEAKIRVLAPDHCHTYILANVNPNLAFLPQSLLEFVMKKLCGFLLNKLQTAAKKVLKDPVRNIHAQRMRDESAFYQKWLLPKFRAISADRGWVMPTISAFELTEAQQMEAKKVNETRAIEGLHSFGYFDDPKSPTSDGSMSTRSEPNLYESLPLGSKDDDSEISSLSGTSQSIWKNNPISSYLRDVEAKTQERKIRAVQDSRRTAAARLRPRPLPMDKKDRLKELKMHKERKRGGRTFSSDSIDGSLPPVDEISEGDTVRSPYSPIAAALSDKGRWPRWWVVSFLVMCLFVLLHMDRFLPTFDYESLGMWSSVLRDAVTLLYIALCGVVFFLLCDVELIYVFESYEMGMKTGDQVKSFYRGKVRLAVAAASGGLVALSVTKAVVLASLKASLIGASGVYNSLLEKYFGVDTGHNGEHVEPAIEESEGVVEGLNESIFHNVLSAYTAFMAFIRVVFDWQVRVFVHSNVVGRSLETVITMIYNAWINVLTLFGNYVSSFLEHDATSQAGFSSWRGDAIGTLRVLLLYTAMFLLVVLALFNFVARSYRHKPTENTSERPSIAATSDASDSDPALIPSCGGSMPIPKPRRMASSSRSTDSATRRRLQFRRKRKEVVAGDDSD